MVAFMSRLIIMFVSAFVFNYLGTIFFDQKQKKSDYFQLKYQLQTFLFLDIFETRALLYTIVLPL